MNDLSKDFEYFQKNLEELKKLYLNKYIVIKNQKVLGQYDNFEDAMEETKKTEKVGTFLIQKVDENPGTYTIYYNDIAVLL